MSIILNSSPLASGASVFTSMGDFPGTTTVTCTVVNATPPTLLEGIHVVLYFTADSVHFVEVERHICKLVEATETHIFNLPDHANDSFLKPPKYYTPVFASDGMTVIGLTAIVPGTTTPTPPALDTIPPWASFLVAFMNSVDNSASVTVSATSP